MAYPAQYYVIPEQHYRLSDDRQELIFDQHLPNVDKDRLEIEVLADSLCLTFTPRGMETVSRCVPLPYPVVPESAVADFKDGILLVRAKLRDVPKRGVKITF